MKATERKTPLTDAQAFNLSKCGARIMDKAGKYTTADFARALERSLAEMAEKVEILHQNAIMCRNSSECGYYAQNYLASIIKQANDAMEPYEVLKKEVMG